PRRGRDRAHGHPAAGQRRLTRRNATGRRACQNVGVTTSEPNSAPQPLDGWDPAESERLDAQFDVAETAEDVRHAEALRAGLEDYHLDEADTILLEAHEGESAENEGEGPLPVLAIVGRPNVGKSTLVNRILGRREAVVQDTPGV